MNRNFVIVAAIALSFTFSPCDLTAQNEIPKMTKGKLDRNDQLDPLLRKISQGKLAAPHKIHKVKFAANTGYILELVSDEFDPLLRVEDAKGNVLAFDDDGGQGLNSRAIFTTEDQGSYKVIVTALDGRSGNYILTIKPAPKEIIFARGGLLQKEEDIQKVKLEKGKSYVINLSSSVPNFDTLLKVKDANGKQLAEDDDGGEGLNSRLTFKAPETGTYQLVVTSFMQRSQGPYQLTVQEAE